MLILFLLLFLLFLLSELLFLFMCTVDQIWGCICECMFWCGKQSEKMYNNHEKLRKEEKKEKRFFTSKKMRHIYIERGQMHFYSTYKHETGGLLILLAGRMHMHHNTACFSHFQHIHKTMEGAITTTTTTKSSINNNIKNRTQPKVMDSMFTAHFHVSILFVISLWMCGT